MEEELFRKTGAREVEKKGIFGVRYTEKRGKLSAPQVTAAKAAHRKAEKQLVGNLIRQWPVGNIEPQVLKQKVDLKAAQATATVINVMLERSFPLVDLPTRSKAATHGKAVAKVDVKTSPAAVDSMWTCTTCSRSMLKMQQQDHLAGEVHIACSKQVLSTASNAPLQPTTAKEDSLQAATITTTRSQKAKAKPATKNPARKSRKNWIQKQKAQKRSS